MFRSNQLSSASGSGAVYVGSSVSHHRLEETWYLYLQNIKVTRYGQIAHTDLPNKLSRIKSFICPTNAHKLLLNC